MVDFRMQFCQECRRSDRKPPCAAELERPEVAAPICGAEKRVGILFELLERYSGLGRDLA